LLDLLVVGPRLQARTVLQAAGIGLTSSRSTAGELVWLQLAAAAVHYACEEYENGDALLREAVTQGLGGQFLEHPFWQHPVAADLVLIALRRDVAVDYFRRFADPQAPLLPTASSGYLWPVRIYVLGRFSLRVDGIPLVFGHKAQKRPIELLQALIALGGRQVSQFELEDTLWPNTPPTLSRKSFTIALYRLRKLIGARSLILHDGKLTLNPSRCWVDLWVFERQLGQIEHCLAINGGKTGDLWRQIGRALNLCRGQFLAMETDQPWMLLLREKLRHQVRRLFKEVGRCLGRDGQCEQAIAVYHKALEVDPLAEEFYRRLMICYAALGRRSEALSTYQACRKILQVHLRVAPSPLTETVVRKIREEQSGNPPSILCGQCRSFD
jgi:DNA-binding SARP family transcriptional activator